MTSGLVFQKFGLFYIKLLLCFIINQLIWSLPIQDVILRNFLRGSGSFLMNDKKEGLFYVENMQLIYIKLLLYFKANQLVGSNSLQDIILEVECTLWIRRVHDI